MNSDMTVHTAVWQCKTSELVLDLAPHMEVAQIRIEKIRFHVVCAIHTVMTKTDRKSHVSKKKKSDLCHICLQAAETFYQNRPILA